MSPIPPSHATIARAAAIASAARRARAVRRALRALATLALVATTTACAPDPPTVTPPAPTMDPSARATPVPGAATWDIDVLNEHPGLGFERIAFRLQDADGQPVRAGSAQVVFYRVLAATGLTQRVASGEALYFGPNLPGGGAWVAYTELDSSGPWVMDVNVTAQDGRSGRAEARIIVEGRGTMPITGQPPPFGDTPTLADVTSVAEITSDRAPLEALYALSVEEAVGNGRPTLVHFGSPAHCEGDACRAALTEVRALYGRYRDRVDFVHVESRDLESPSEPSEAAAAWELPNEPWTFLFDANGFLNARIEGAISNDELGLLLDRVVAGR